MAQRVPVVLSVGGDLHQPVNTPTDTLTTASIPVSNEPGNLIQKRDDGLYYALTAPADISRLYCDDIFGSDETGDGSRLDPFRTAQKAVDTIAERAQSGDYRIYLKCGGFFTLDKNTWLGNGTFGLSFTFYGDRVYGDAYDRDGYWVSCSAELDRPTLHLETYLDPSGNGFVHPTGIYATPRMTDLEFRGLKLSLYNSNGGVTGGGWFFYPQRLVFCGTDIEYAPRYQGFGSAETIALLSTSIDFIDPEGSPMFIADFGPAVFGRVAIREGETNTDPRGEFPPCTGKASNYLQVLTPSNLMADAVFDTTTKTLFGWSTNWDIFAFAAQS